MAYEINYNDERLTKIEAERDAAIKESDQLYDSMINDSTQYFDKQIEAAEQWGETQKQNQQAQTDFAIEQIEQQKQQAQKDYQKEQSAAYVDWQKQKNDYGTNAEQQAASGLAHSGYSESAQVKMYTAYQNRVAIAKESVNKAVLEYNNAMTEARLQNSSVLAEIAYNTLMKSLELSLNGFQYEKQLVLEKASKKAEIDDRFYNRYQNEIAQINHENSMAEQIRQFNASQRRSSSGGSGYVVKDDDSGYVIKDGESTNLSFSSYNEAFNYLKENYGASIAEELSSHWSWTKKRSFLPNSAEAQYDTYPEYLNAYVDWATNNTE